MIRRLWVIEMLYDDGIWFPQEAEFTREAARAEMTSYIENNPGDKFRVREYRPYAAVSQSKESK